MARNRLLWWGAIAVIGWAVFKGEHGPKPPVPPSQSGQLSAPPIIPDVQRASKEPTSPPSQDSTTRAAINPSGVIPGQGAHQYVRGSNVALRAAPSKTSALLDRLAKGSLVDVLDRTDGWTMVRTQVMKEGWVSSALLSDAPPMAEADKPPSKAPQVEKPLTVAAVVTLLIRESIASYPGSCPCEYSTDRGGRRCGRRSAHSKPGGYSPLCYPSDVTKEMIAAYLAR